MQRFHLRQGSESDPNGTDWRFLDLEDSAQAKDLKAQLRHKLNLLLSCDHLMVLVGLGASLEIPPPPESTKKSLFATMPDLWEEAATVLGEDMDKARAGVNYASKNQTNIEEFLSLCLMARDLRIAIDGVDFDAFVTKAETVIVKECAHEPTKEQLQPHIDLLRRLIRRPNRAARAELFTTNYDRCFELAASAADIVLLDGFSMNQPRCFRLGLFDLDLVLRSEHADQPDYYGAVLRYFKLHGSVNWNRNADGSVEQVKDPDQPAMIYPASSKFRTSYTQPFFEMMTRFQSGLRRRNVGLLTICCGFKDEHLITPILTAIESNPTLRVVVVAPDLSDLGARTLYEGGQARGACQSNEHLKRVYELARSDDESVTLVNASLAGLVTVLPALPMTDSERRAAQAQVQAEAMTAADGSNDG